VTEGTVTEAPEVQGGRVEQLIGAMARRDVRGQLLIAPFEPTRPMTAGTPSVPVRLVPCARCGADGPRSWAPPFRVPAGPGGDDPAPWPTLVLLACERVPARSLLPLVTAAVRAGGLPGVVVRTRAVAWAGRTGPAGGALSRLDEAEAWADQVIAGAGEPGLFAGVPPVLPAVTRPHGGGEPRGDLEPHFLTPHDAGPELSRLNQIYLACRRTAVRAAF
jgi:hypothetical protein